MMALSTGNFEDLFGMLGTKMEKAMESALSEAYEKKKAQVLSELAAEINRKKAETIASLMIQLHSMVSYERFGQTIRIEIVTVDENKDK